MPVLAFKKDIYSAIRSVIKTKEPISDTGRYCHKELLEMKLAELDSNSTAIKPLMKLTKRGQAYREIYAPFYRTDK